MLHRSVFLALLFVTGCTDDKSSTPAEDDRAPFSERPVLYPTDGAPQRVAMPPLPDTLTFAGEPVPLERDYVREGLERELLVNTFWQSHTILILKSIERWRPLIEKTLREHDVPTDFIYLAVAESEFENTARSPAGAVGMWQFMPPTARDYGLYMGLDADMRRDPKLATAAASRYLKWAHSHLGSWSLVAASYNRGLSGTQKLLKAQQTDNYWDLYLNPETARYFYRILAFKLILEDPEAYGYFLDAEKHYRPYQFEIVEIRQDTDLIAFAKRYNTTYKALRELNPWLNNAREYRLRVPRGAVFEMRVPAVPGS